jgi:hypothetical protein
MKGNKRGQQKLMVRKSSKPAVYSTVLNPPPVRVTARGRGSLVEGTERFVTVSGQTAFTALGFACQPTHPNFNILLRQGQLYESYRVESLEVLYIPSDGVTTTVGTIYLGWDYDCLDSLPATVQNLVAMHSKAGRPYESFSLRVDCRRIHRALQVLRVRGGPPPGGNINGYDMGKLIIGVINASGSVAWGAIWIRYRIAFFNPSLNLVQALSTATAYTAPSNVVLHGHFANPRHWRS